MEFVRECNDRRRNAVTRDSDEIFLMTWRDDVALNQKPIRNEILSKSWNNLLHLKQIIGEKPLQVIQ